MKRPKNLSANHPIQSHVSFAEDYLESGGVVVELEHADPVGAMVGVEPAVHA